MEIIELKREMETLLEKFNYPYTEYGINEIVGTWAKNKGDILTLFSKHPNYNGKGQIVFSSKFQREINEEAVETFFRKLDLWIKGNVKENFDNIYDICQHLRYGGVDTFVTSENAEYLGRVYPELKAKEGMKMSRLVNRFCIKIGFDEEPEYHREFAKFADAINPLQIDRIMVISVNPIDYLTMSFGNSWASCHTIDKEDIRRKGGSSYSGCYSSGTLSYMLDETSIIYYTIDSDYKGEEPELQDKINRCMFHLGENFIIQGRVYPQTEDGHDGIYLKIRESVQDVIAKCMDIPNLWINNKGISACAEVIKRSEGTHYRDYENFAFCNVSFQKRKRDCYRAIKIGHDPICPQCGYEHDREDNIVCERCDGVYCADCGSLIDCDYENYVYDEYSGEYYCEQCCSYCDYHEEWEHEELIEVEGYGKVCRKALDYINCIMCDWCDTYKYEEYIWTKDGGNYCCPSCAEEAGYGETEDGWQYRPEENGYYYNKKEKIYLFKEEI